MPGLAERFPIEEILLLEVDLRKMLGPLLNLDPTGGTGGISTAIMIERKPEFLCRIEQRRIAGHRSASAFGMKKRHQRHPRASI
jgi:hypothetical protein